MASRNQLIKKIRMAFRDLESQVTDASKSENTTDATAELQDDWYSYGEAFDLRLDDSRDSLYRDYEQIYKINPEAARALDTAVDIAFQGTTDDSSAWFLETEDPQMQEIHDKIEERIGLQRRSKTIQHKSMMLGDGFLELIWAGSGLPNADEGELLRIKWLTPERTYLNFDEWGLPKAKSYFQITNYEGKVVAEVPWVMGLHVKYRPQEGCNYGTSFFYNTRWPHRCLHPMEQSLVVNRVINGGDNLHVVVHVDKSATAAEREAVSRRVAQQLTRRHTIDGDGFVQFQKSPTNEGNVFVHATHDPTLSKMERISGGNSHTQLDDVEHFHSKLISSLRTPKAYLGFERDVNAKATLSQEDIQYAREIRAVQESSAEWIREVYSRAARIQLFRIPDFEIVFPPISFVAERLRIEIQEMKWKIAATAKAAMGIGTRWLLANIVGLDEEAIDAIVSEPDFMSQPGEKQQAEAISAVQNDDLRKMVSDFHGKVETVMREKLVTDARF
jgi:hypothetical protein